MIFYSPVTQIFTKKSSVLGWTKCSFGFFQKILEKSQMNILANIVLSYMLMSGFRVSVCSQGFRGGSGVKILPAKAGDMGSIPGLGRSPGGGTGNLLQYSCLGNAMNRGACQAAVHEVTKESDRTERPKPPPSAHHVNSLCLYSFSSNKHRVCSGCMKGRDCEEFSAVFAPGRVSFHVFRHTSLRACLHYKGPKDSDSLCKDSSNISLKPTQSHFHLLALSQVFLGLIDLFFPRANRTF